MAKKKSLNDIDAALAILGSNARRGSEKASVQVMPTSINELNDIVLGCGGLPRGKVIELYARESVGKSTLAYWFAGEVIKAGGTVVLFDAEGGYVPKYGATCGIDNEKLILPEFGLGEDVLGQVKVLLAANIIDLIIVDAIPSLQPETGSEQIVGEAKKMNESLARAKMLTAFFTDISGGFRIKRGERGARFIKDGEGDTLHKIHDKKTCLIFINHAKDKIGVMYGEREYTPGGNAINFASSIRLGMKYIKKSKEKDENNMSVYKIIRIKAVKNKLAPPLCEMDLKMLRVGGIEALNKDIEKETEELSIEDDSFIREMKTETNDDNIR